ncbi:hypothetical protein THAOC_28197, partial [Thalassiosira oceanica]
WTCIQESSDELSDELSSALGNLERQRAQHHAGGPSRRFGYVSVVHKNKFVLFGGFDGSRWLNDMFDGVERKADFFACDLASYTWSELPSVGKLPSPRYFHSCCIHSSKLYTYGGYNGTDRLADMFAYGECCSFGYGVKRVAKQCCHPGIDFETNHWSEVDCSLGERPSGRSSLVAQVHGNSLYIFGGYNGSTVLNDFYKFRLQPDVIFVVEGQEVHANRAMLAVRSQYFDALLFGGMSESIGVDEEGDRKPIVLNDVSYECFKQVIEFLYTDRVQDLTWDNGVPLLIASEQFMLDRLKALCEDQIRRDIAVENVIGIFIASHRHNALGLKEIALEFILRNLTDPAIIAGLSDLKTEPDLLVEIITKNASNPFLPPADAAAVEFTNNEWAAR